MKKLIALFILVMVSNTAFAGINIVAATTPSFNSANSSESWEQIHEACQMPSHEYAAEECTKAATAVKKLEARWVILAENMATCKANVQLADVCDVAKVELVQISILILIFAVFSIGGTIFVVRD